MLASRFLPSHVSEREPGTSAQRRQYSRACESHPPRTYIPKPLSLKSVNTPRARTNKYNTERQKLVPFLATCQKLHEALRLFKAPATEKHTYVRDTPTPHAYQRQHAGRWSMNVGTLGARFFATDGYSRYIKKTFIQENGSPREQNTFVSFVQRETGSILLNTSTPHHLKIYQQRRTQQNSRAGVQLHRATIKRLRGC